MSRLHKSISRLWLHLPQHTLRSLVVIVAASIIDRLFFEPSVVCHLRNKDIVQHFLALLFDAIYSSIVLVILTLSFTELRNFQDAVREQLLCSHYFFQLHRSDVRNEMNLTQDVTASLVVYFGIYTLVIKVFGLSECLLRVSEAVMVLLILLLELYGDTHYKHFRIALGRSKLDSSMLKKLFHVFPERNYWDEYGFDGKSDVQLLVHDTLRRRKMSVRRLKQLVDLFPNVLDRVDLDGMTPFQLACQFSSVYVVRYLLCLEASYLNVRNEREETPLHLACRHGNHKVAEYLIDNAPFLVATTNEEGDLPIHLLWGAAGEWKDHVSSTQYLGVVWRMLLACPEAVCRPGAFSALSSQTKAASMFDFRQLHKTKGNHDDIRAFQVGTSDGSSRSKRGQLLDNAKRERRKKTGVGAITSSFEASSMASKKIASASDAFVFEITASQTSVVSCVNPIFEGIDTFKYMLWFEEMT